MEQIPHDAIDQIAPIIDQIAPIINQIDAGYAPQYHGPIICVPGVTDEEEIATRCEHAGLSYAYAEERREAQSTARMLGECIVCLLVVVALIIVWGIAHDLPLPPALGGK